ncbi:regulator [Skermanella stibiiresistens SB22]|uniref:Regulator n=1 Tax=Skermanella stibiiresistens SB22 TaxID=1385369 RepID=W9HDD1_9PROT|nr:response regulator [Skermanella stibiiresistens]EWY42687.1 regulator [Skermanella stibiiresistens SB22]
MENASSSGLQVLLVEDEAVIAMLLAEVLYGMGHHVCATATTEAAAVAAAARHKPDLMIVDEKLTIGSGSSAVAEIMRHIQVPYVFVSGALLRNETLNPMAVILQKPFTVNELVGAIKRAVATAAPPHP